jgi:spermidine synthase
MYAMQVNGFAPYATDDELEWMAEFGKTLKPSSQVVMLGAGPGVLLLALKEHNRDLSAHVVDIAGHDYVRHYLKDMQGEENVTYEIGDSTIAGQGWEDPLIDLLIVDTDHTEDTTTHEIETWMPHVRTGGIIFFHDYDAVGTRFEHQEQYPGVKVAVDAMMSRYKLVARIGCSIIYQKRRARE